MLHNGGVEIEFVFKEYRTIIFQINSFQIYPKKYKGINVDVNRVSIQQLQSYDKS